jgi:hypothetical protein
VTTACGLRGAGRASRASALPLAHVRRLDAAARENLRLSAALLGRCRELGKRPGAAGMLALFSIAAGSTLLVAGRRRRRGFEVAH